jgi:hypothetical protein
MLVREHRDRNDIYEEAEVCIRSGRDSRAVAEQIDAYRKQGYPSGDGLYINSVLFRKPTDEVTALNKAWWQQIEKYSFRDQLSLPYVLHTQGTEIKKVEYTYFGECFSERRKHKFPGSKEL